MTVEPLKVRARDLSVAFGGVRAVDGLSLEITTGTITALVGPNGAGKSTVLNLLSGFYPCDGGDLTLVEDSRTTDLMPLRVEDRAALGISRTFQTPKLFPHLAVWENVVAATVSEGRLVSQCLEALSTRAAARGQRRRRDAALATLERVSLRDKADLMPSELSLGEQRLLEMARTMQGGARMLLLDEPFAGLSHDERERLVGEIKRLEADGVGILLVEHDLETVRRLASFLLVMNEGRELRRGTPATVLVDAKVIEVFLGPEVLTG
jgi:ABC-type branched-subunit amino acid transport system ATPase component